MEGEAAAVGWEMRMRLCVQAEEDVCGVEREEEGRLGVTVGAVGGGGGGQAPREKPGS